VSPEDVNSLFDDSFRIDAAKDSSSSPTKGSYDDEEDNDDEYEDEDELAEDLVASSAGGKDKQELLVMTSAEMAADEQGREEKDSVKGIPGTFITVNGTPEPKKEDSNFMSELMDLEKQMQEEQIVSASVDLTPADVASEKEKKREDKDIGNQVIEEELNFYNLGGALDKSKERRVLDSISMSQGGRSSFSTLDRSPRVTSYDPRDFQRGDPMKYGAYRRWQPPTDEEGNVKQKGGKRSVSRGGGRGKKIGKPSKNKNKGGGDTNKFYDALKNLSSGPRDAGSDAGTGVSEPNNKKPIQPGKAPSRKVTRRLVSPKDIDNIFEDDTESDDEKDEYVDGEEEEAGDVDNNNGRPIDIRKLVEMRDIPTFGGSMFDDVEEEEEEDSVVEKSIEAILQKDNIPEWLTKADKDAKNARKVQKKKKKLTNDWRFWAAIIAGIGFTSAAFNVYSSQSGNIDDRPVGTSVQTPPNLPSAPKLKNPGELII
jgi:hypothetical protein